MITAVVDIETDSLTPTVVHCIVPSTVAIAT